MMGDLDLYIKFQKLGASVNSISIDSDQTPHDQVLIHAASGRNLYLYCSQMHLIFGI